MVLCWFLSGRTPDTQLARCKLVKKTHPNHGGRRRPTAAMVPRPRRRRTQQSANMISDKSVLFKVEDVIFLLFISYVMARHVIEASSTRRVCVCLLRRLPLADFGQRKVAVTHTCTFDCHFRMAEPGRTVMGVRYRRRRKPCWGCFLRVFEGDLS